MSNPAPSLPPTLGWREWVALPDLGVEWTKAKIDTGARSSALHAFNLESFVRGDDEWVRFEVHPMQRSASGATMVEAPVHEHRSVRSSSGHSESRPVIRTPISLGDRSIVIDLTLALRDQMGFRMLIGREAVRRRFLIDPGRSYLGPKPKKATRQHNRLTS